MLDKTFKKFDEVFKVLNEEMKELFGKSHEDASVLKRGSLTVLVTDDCIYVNGPFKELRINGKLVRFKER